MLMSAEERTGWRDEALSKRHREWGCDCPAVDIDFLLIEYDHAEPKALVEYKNQHAAPITVSKNASLIAMAKVATRANIPAFIVRYADDFSWWKVCALNQIASNFLPETEEPPMMDEIGWVTLLYKVRNRKIPQSVIDRINQRSNKGVIDADS